MLAMERFNNRLIELLAKKKDVENELADINLRISKLKKLEENTANLLDQEVPASGESKVPTSAEASVVDKDDDIEAEYEVFVPGVLEVSSRKQEVRMIPKIALPHSKPLWDRVARVRRKVDRPPVRLIAGQGQFTGVEEEELAMWRDSWTRQWTWNKMGSYVKDDEFKCWLLEPSKKNVQKLRSVDCSQKSHGKEVSISREESCPVENSEGGVAKDTSKKLSLEPQKSSTPVDPPEMRNAIIKVLTDVKCTSSLDNLRTLASQHGRGEANSHDVCQGFGRKTTKTVLQDTSGVSSERKDKVLTKIKSILNKEMMMKVKSSVTGEDAMDNFKLVQVPTSGIASSTEKVLGEGLQSNGEGSRDQTEKLSRDGDDVSSMTANKRIESVRAKLATVRCNVYSTRIAGISQGNVLEPV